MGSSSQDGRAVVALAHRHMCRTSKVMCLDLRSPHKAYSCLERGIDVENVITPANEYTRSIFDVSRLGRIAGPVVVRAM